MVSLQKVSNAAWVLILGMLIALHLEWACNLEHPLYPHLIQDPILSVFFFPVKEVKISTSKHSKLSTSHATHASNSHFLLIWVRSCHCFLPDSKFLRVRQVFWIFLVRQFRWTKILMALLPPPRLTMNEWDILSCSSANHRFSLTPVLTCPGVVMTPLPGMEKVHQSLDTYYKTSYDLSDWIKIPWNQLLFDGPLSVWWVFYLLCFFYDWK